MQGSVPPWQCTEAAVGAGIYNCVWTPTICSKYCVLVRLLPVMSSIISRQAHPFTNLALEVVCGLGSTSWLSRGDSSECSEEDWEVGLQLVWTDVFMAAFAYGGRSRQFPFSLALTIPQSRLPVI